MGHDRVPVVRAPLDHVAHGDRGGATPARGVVRRRGMARRGAFVVGAANDRAEVEADRVAEQVTRRLRQPADPLGPDASMSRVCRSDADVTATNTPTGAIDPISRSRIVAHEVGPVSVVGRVAPSSRIRRATDAMVLHQPAPSPALVDGLAEYLPRLPAGLVSMATKLLDAVRRGELRITAQQAQPLMALFVALCDELAGVEEGPAVSADGGVMPGGMVAISDVIATVLGADVSSFLEGEDFFVPASWLLAHVPGLWAAAGGPPGVALDGPEVPALPGPGVLALLGQDDEVEGDERDDDDGPDSDPGPGPVANAGRAVPPVLPDVLVAGPNATTSAQLPGEAAAHHDIEAIAAHAVLQYPLIPIDRLRIAALRNIRHKARSKVERVTEGADAGDDAYFQAVVARFRAAVDVAIEQAWAASKANPGMAAHALVRAKLDPTKAAIPHATAIYDNLYQVLAFAAPAIAEITSASAEQPLLDLCVVIPPLEWPAFLVAATSSAAMLAFARAHHADLAGVADTAAIVRCWQANDIALTSVVDCQTLLGLALINNDVGIAIVAARLLGTPQILNLGALTTLVGSGLFLSIARIRQLCRLGGDVTANKRMLDLPGAPQLTDEQVTAFNVKCGTTVADAVQCWTQLSTNVTDDDKKLQIIRSMLKAPNATRAHFLLLVQNYATLMDRTTILASRVVTLIDAGIVIPKGKVYDSGTWGRGCVYVFNFAGQGRLTPEWHLHFNFGKNTTVAGAGWKNKDEKYGSGTKTFGSAPNLEASIEKAGAWLRVRV